MKKKVKIYVTGRPVALSNSIKAFGYHGPLELSTEDIFKCLACGARVIEISGTEEKVLNFNNYNTVNFVSSSASNTPKVAKVTTPPVEHKKEIERVKEVIEAEPVPVEVETIPPNISTEKLVTQEPVGKAIDAVLNNGASSNFTSNKNKKSNRNRY